MNPSQDQKQTILVTGSSGLIGSAIAAHFARDFHVVGFDTKPPGRRTSVEHHDVDLTSDESVTAALARVKQAHGDRIASVIHLAAYYDFAGEPSDLYEQVTIRGTGRLVRALRAFYVEQFFFSSSMLVHAPGESGRPIHEESPVEPTWDYPRSKVETEKLLHDERGEMPVVIARIAGVYDDACHSIPIAHQIQRIFEKKLIARFYPGDPSRGQAFVHLDDLVTFVRLAVDRRRKLPAELVVLAGEAETISYDEIQRTTSRLLFGEEWETTVVPKAVAKAGAWLQDQLPGEAPFIKPWMVDRADDHYELDITRAKIVLDWEPKRSLRMTLPKMIARLQADPVAWYRANKLEVPAKLEDRAAPHAPPAPSAK